MTTCDKCDGFCPTILIPPLKKLAVIAEGENNTWRRLENFLPPWAANCGTRIIWRPEIGVPPESIDEIFLYSIINFKVPPFQETPHLSMKNSTLDSLMKGRLAIAPVGKSLG